MGDLVLGLLVLGVVLFVAVLVYNRVQERSARRALEQAFEAPRADTLLIQKLSIEATGGKGLPVTWDGMTVKDEHLFRQHRKAS